MFLNKGLVLITIVFSALDTTVEQQTYSLDESILCRACGNNVSLTKHIISNKLSAASKYTFNDTIFGKEGVLVQELLGDFLFDFPVVTFLDSTCSGIGEWEESTWFPGYLSRPCACTECGTYLGWVFQPSNPNKKSYETFFGFILTGIIGESCKSTLLYL